MSQKDDVLRHLQSGKSITPIEALNLYGSFRLSDIVFTLKAEGHDITTEINKAGKPYAIYRLKQKDGLFKQTQWGETAS